MEFGQRFASTAAPIRESFERIMLSSGGVGYFEYEATVDGNATKVTVDRVVRSSMRSSKRLSRKG